MLDQDKLIFNAMLSHRENLENHPNFKRFHETMESREALAKHTKATEEQINTTFKITACNQQRYFYNRYEYYLTKAWIERYFKDYHDDQNYTATREKEAARYDVIAQHYYEQYKNLDEAAQKEDDERCAEAETREAERIEEYYR